MSRTHSEKIFTDGSYFVHNGKRKADYAVVTAEQVLEAKSLPQGTSAQLAELVALTQALELSKGPETPAVSTQSSTRGLRVPEQLERQASGT